MIKIKQLLEHNYGNILSINNTLKNGEYVLEIQHLASPKLTIKENIEDILSHYYRIGQQNTEDLMVIAHLEGDRQLLFSVNGLYELNKDFADMVDMY